MKIHTKMSKYEDAMLYILEVYSEDIDKLYSVTMVDAYRTPWVKLMDEKELTELIEEW